MIKLIFVAGVEGSGHSLIRDIFKHCQSKINIEVDGLLQNMIARLYCCDSEDLKILGNEPTQNFSKFASMNSCQTTRKACIEEIKNHTAQSHAKGTTHIAINMVSFPFGNPRNAVRRPDLLELQSIFEHIAELRILALWRAPITSAYSGYRRGFSDSLYLQSRIIEDNLIYLDAQLRSCNKERIQIINFEELINKPEPVLHKLSTFIEVDKRILMNFSKRIRPFGKKGPYNTAIIPEEERNFLESFFSEQRIQQWNLPRLRSLL